MSDFPILSFLSQKGQEDTSRKGKRVKSYSNPPGNVGVASTPTNITLSNDEFDRLFANRESKSFKATKALRELMASDD